MATVKAYTSTTALPHGRPHATLDVSFRHEENVLTKTTGWNKATCRPRQCYLSTQGNKRHCLARCIAHLYARILLRLTESTSSRPKSLGYRTATLRGQGSLVRPGVSAFQENTMISRTDSENGTLGLRSPRQGDGRANKKQGRY